MSLGVVHSFKVGLLLVDVVLVKFSFNLGTLRDLLRTKGRENREEQEKVLEEGTILYPLTLSSGFREKRREWKRLKTSERICTQCQGSRIDGANVVVSSA